MELSTAISHRQPSAQRPTAIIPTVVKDIHLNTRFQQTRTKASVSPEKTIHLTCNRPTTRPGRDRRSTTLPGPRYLRAAAAPAPPAPACGSSGDSGVPPCRLRTGHGREAERGACGPRDEELDGARLTALLRDPAAAAKGLETFVSVARTLPSAQVYDVVEGYVKISMECAEIFKLLDGERKPESEMLLVFQALEAILLRTASNRSHLWE
ncbi:nucleolar pre-ribosomal-associated protein 1-like [Chamaea fasciata]|uniref:nucleolar pre-ribosomal-associated protein 1-like n=1 Tax=Chamaea fasciata TaxID=190680 RepID=UPI00336A757F